MRQGNAQRTKGPLHQMARVIPRREVQPPPAPIKSKEVMTVNQEILGVLIGAAIAWVGVITGYFICKLLSRT
jgi:hypothetical protein